MLITARLLQGGLGALLIPQGMGLLIANFSREQFPRAASAFGPVMGGAAVLGPIVAGFLIGVDIGGLTWRPVFLINIVLCAAGLAAALRLLPRDDDLRPVSIDGLGAGLLGVSMLGLIYGLIDGSTAGWTAVPAGCLALGAVFLVAFAVRQVKARDPLIHPSLLRNRGFTAGLLLGLGYFAAVNGFAYVISLFFQLGLGLSPELAAVSLAPMMAGIIVSSLVCRPLIPRLGRGLVVAGLLVTLLAAAGLLVTAVAAGTSVTAWLLAPSVLVLGLGMGASFSSIFDVAIGDVHGEEAGSASGSLSAVQQLAAAIGSAVVTTVYFAQAGHSTAVHALAVSVAVVAGITLACLGLVWLLPAKAAAESWE
jgi:MFS family permease